MIDLMKYCLHPRRPDIKRPFSQGNYTYAANEDFLVRVPLLHDVPPQKAPNVSRVWPNYEPVSWVKPLKFEFPDPETVTCEACFDGGVVHSCPNCTCVCMECGGTEEIPVIRCVNLREILIQEKYARLMLELPELEIEHQPPMMGPVQFRFDGGRGLVMPYRQGTKYRVPIIGTMMEDT